MYGENCQPRSFGDGEQRRNATTMIGWIVRGLLALSGIVAGWFVSSEALNFGIIQMAIAILLFTAFVAVVAFWPIIMQWFGKGQKPDR